MVNDDVNILFETGPFNRHLFFAEAGLFFAAKKKEFAFYHP